MSRNSAGRRSIWWFGLTFVVIVGIVAAVIILVPAEEAAAEESLEPFDSCDALLDYAKREALERVTAWGLEGGWGVFPIAEVGVADEAEATLGGEAPQATAAREEETQNQYSTTNVQEAGIDEPDLVKTDGERIVVLSGPTLYVLSTDLEILSTVDLSEEGWFNEMFLVGDRVVLLGDHGGTYRILSERFASVPYYSGIAAIAEIDLSDSAAPELLRTTYIDGQYLSARLHGDVVRVVVSSYPTGFEWSYPIGSGLRAEREALRENEALIEGSTIDNWLPYFVEVDHGSGSESEGLLLSCDDAYHPRSFSGFGMLTIAAFGPDGLGDSTGVMADGETVYASDNAVYVATNHWDDLYADENARSDGVRTQIHAFDIDGATTDYAASGSVSGYLLNQFSMSEWDEHLRVATTSSQWRGSSEDSESQVVILGRSGRELVETGSVGGLGRGEQIYSVRFVGPTGYVVTFRQIDPLYVVDLSDHTSPRLAGELEITGYSSYLHPVSADRILGVGQEATEEGWTTGTKVAMFDVSDPQNPQRLYDYTLADAWSEAEWDHRAFLLWEDTLVIPLEVWGHVEPVPMPAIDDEVVESDGGADDGTDATDVVQEAGVEVEEAYPEDSFSGAVILRINGSFEEIAMVEHPGGVRRSLVIGDRLYLVGYSAIQMVNLVDGAPIEGGTLELNGF
jgi:uncharacterized secreted protein with C-terminal beta-propeller domain